MGLVETYVVMALLFGGTLGWGISQSSDKNITEELAKAEREPANWDARFHKKFLRECARQCRKSGARFKSYEPVDGSCNCYGVRKHK